MKIAKNRLEILNEVYGDCVWSESALISLLRVMELTRQDERSQQTQMLEDYKTTVVESIVNMLMVQHEAAQGRHKYWLCAAELIRAECLEKEE